MKIEKLLNGFVIGTFVILYLVVSTISTIHSIEFFRLSNPNWLAIFLAVAFEIGAAASLASIVVLRKVNMYIVWSLFILLTAMQAMSNTYHSYVHLHDFTGWIELFGLQEEDLIFQKRILALISGSILPLIALGFIKSLVDYIKPESVEIKEQVQPANKLDVVDMVSDSGLNNPLLVEPDRPQIDNNPDSNISRGNEKNIM